MNSMNFLLVIYEKLGFIQPKLVAVKDYDVELQDEEDDDFSYIETITFYLMEYPSGRRDYKVHSYGRCAVANLHEVYLRDVLIWVCGGPLPYKAEQPGKPDIIQLSLVKE
jgi:hypothetical protein